MHSMHRVFAIYGLQVHEVAEPYATTDCCGVSSVCTVSLIEIWLVFS